MGFNGLLHIIYLFPLLHYVIRAAPYTSGEPVCLFPTLWHSYNCLPLGALQLWHLRKVGTVYCVFSCLYHSSFSLGNTDIPEEVFNTFLEGIANRYTAEAYQLFTHNCNHFSNEVSDLLTGTGIPSGLSSSVVSLLLHYLFRYPYTSRYILEHKTGTRIKTSFRQSLYRS